MPAAGRGAFSTPRAPLSPPKPPPHRAPIAAAHPSTLATVVQHAVRQATATVQPAIHAASHVRAQPITRAVAQTGHSAAHAVSRDRPQRGELPPAVLRALIEQHPQVRLEMQARLDWARLQQQAQQKQILEQQRQAQTGRGSALDLGVVNLTPLATKLATGHLLPSALGIVSKLGNEALDLPAQTFLSSAIAGSAGRKALEGNTQPLAQLGGSVLQQIEHPVRSFKEAPLSTALLLAGGENALGRLAGRAGRLGETVDRATGEVLSPGLVPSFTRSRPSLKLYGDLEKEQHYNADPLRKAAQVAFERSLPKLPGRLKQADPFQAEGWRLQRHAVGGIVQPGRVDYLRQAGERTRRVMVNTVKQNALKLAPKHGRDAVPLIFQGIVRSPATLVEDLAKEHRKLEDAAASGDLTSAQMKMNRANLKRVEGLLSDEKFRADPAPAFAAAKRLQAIQRPFEAILLHGGVLRPDQLRAKLFPYAQAHMGAERADEVNPHEQARYDAAVAQHEHLKGLESELRAQLEGRGVRTGERETLKPRERAGAHGPVEAQHARVRELRAQIERLHREGADKLPAKPKPQSGMRKPGGGLLSDEEILAHMRANGVEDVGFMSHKGGLDSGSSYYQATTRLPGTERHLRTGSAFAKGVSDHSWDALVGSMAQKASKAAQLEVRARELRQVALHPAEGGFESHDAARRFGESANVGPNGEELRPGLGKLIPIHLGPDSILHSGVIQPAELEATLHRFGLHNETSLTQQSAGKYGLIPKAVNDRLAAHDNAISARSNVARGAQAYQNAFRAAKLNTSTRHIVGVGAEQAIRIIAEQAGPTAWLTGRKFDRALKHAAEIDHEGRMFDDAGPLGGRMRMIEAQLGTRGGQVQGYKDMRAIRSGRTWSDTTLSGGLAHRADGTVRSKAGQAALAPWHAWSFLVEGSLARLEHATHHALLGKALKDTGFIDSYRDILKLQDQAMHELVTKGITTNKADYIARKTDDFMGNWSHLTPDVRKAVAYLTPFGLWWLNSMRWLYRLPVTHPIKTALAASIYHATEPQRTKEGQGFAAGKDKLPDFLQGTINVNIPGLGPGHLNPTYYSPGGTLGPEALEVAGEQIAPALQGPLLRGLGLDALTHEKQVDAHGNELSIAQKGLNALAETIGGPVPGATQAQQLLEHGGKPLGNANWITDLLHLAGGPATTKPGTQRSELQVLEKMFLPFRYAYESGGHTPAHLRSTDPAARADEALKRYEERQSTGGDVEKRADEALRRYEERQRR